MVQRAASSARQKKAGFLALVAVLLQSFLFAAATPQFAFADPAHFPSGVEYFCGAPAHAHSTPGHNKSAPDCRLCPLCLAVLSGGLGIPPRAPALPPRFFTRADRCKDVPSAALTQSVAQAAQPRGPPALLQNM
jgi:hypothetical protein